MKTTMGYCFHCKKKVEIENGKISQMKNRKGSMLMGICGKCGTKVCRLVG